MISEVFRITHGSFEISFRCGRGAKRLISTQEGNTKRRRWFMATNQLFNRDALKVWGRMIDHDEE